MVMTYLIEDGAGLIIHRQVCSLNEFRAFFGMERHTTFESINADKDISNTLRDLH